MFANMAKAPSVWSYVSKMPQEQFKNLYGCFPQRIRYHLGDWLENQPWDHISGTDPFCTEMANSALKELVKELEKIAKNCGSDALIDLQLLENVKRLCLQEPLGIVHLFKSICKAEMEAVLKQNNRLSAVFQSRQEEMMFNFRSMKLQNKLDQLLPVTQKLKHVLENVGYHPQVQEVLSIQKQWLHLFEESLNILKTVQDQATKRIDIWRKQQQMSGNGAPFDGNVLPLQDRMEFLFGIYNQIIHTIGDLGERGQALVTPRFFTQINSGFETLIKSSFLVDKQPPQVLKTQTKFQASVNFLLGSKILTGVNKMPTIKAHIVTEKKAQELFLAHTESLNEMENSLTRTGTRKTDDGTGEIENGTSAFEITQATRTCGAVFKNMLLKKIKRCERKGSESVTEEKCAVLFTAEINFSGSTYIVQALSLPVVVIVHGNQDNNAKATILWDNAFSEIGRRPFYVEEKVPWRKMCQTLNMKFVSEVGTKHELSPEHFWFLGQKIFGENCIRYDDLKERTVTWAQFNKEPLHERNFTFWQWFDGVVDLTKKHLRDYWSDGLIMGFISKQYVHKILGSEPNGTFLLRFSDSEIGGITIAHVLHGSGQIQNIQPFTAKDLQILSLGDRVKDLKQLTYLHKKGRKDDVFNKYYKKDSDGTNGYTKAIIRLKVLGGNEEKQSPCAWKDHVPMEDEMCQLSTGTSVHYPSPIYGSPVGSPMEPIPTQQIYNPTREPYGLMQSPPLQSLSEPPLYPATVGFMPSYPFVENTCSPWVPPYVPEPPHIQQENFVTAELDLQEILGLLNNEVAMSNIQEDPIPMQ